MTEIVDINGIVSKKLFESFKQVAEENGFNAKEILDDFMKDYVVSGGHPELVVNKWPWNKKEYPI